MEPEKLKKYYNLCNPKITPELEKKYNLYDPNSPYNLDIDNYKIEDKKIKTRGKYWVDSFIKDIFLSEGKICKYFSGHRGSGKTTELKRLISIVEKEENENLLPVYIDSSQYLDIHNEIDVTDIITVIVYKTIEAVSIYLEEDPKSNLKDGYLKRFWEWLNFTEVELEKLKIKSDLNSTLIFDIKNSKNFREEIRKNISSRLSDFKENAFKELTDQETKLVTNSNKKGILIIFDSLEKLRGISSNFEDVLVSAQRVFDSDSEHLKLPVHVIYTVPSSLVRKINNINFLPMIKTDSNGINIVKELIYKRIPKNDLENIFGVDFENRLEDIIKFCGGYLRDILRIMQSAIKADEFPLTKEDIDYIKYGIIDEFKNKIYTKDYQWLADIAKNKSVKRGDAVEDEVADRMFSIHAILQYQNGKESYDLHPALKEIEDIKNLI